jgi:hypothetical protein
MFKINLILIRLKNPRLFHTDKLHFSLKTSQIGYNHIEFVEKPAISI